MSSERFDRMLAALEEADPVGIEGRVRAAVGLKIRAAVPGVRVGEIVAIERRGKEALEAEVVGFVDEEVTLLPLGRAEGIGPGDVVRPRRGPLRIRCDRSLLGRVLDGLGRPIDDGPPIEGRTWDVVRPAPPPLSRPRITKVLDVGVRAIDAFTTLGEGQRIGLFAGSGVGKSTLLAQIARQASADVFVACLIGERGREVREFLEDGLGIEGRARGVVVVATSDAPALVRMRSADVATSIAEYFRDEGARVLLLMDSLTRHARAGREVGLAAGEPPARRGYPPSVFDALPALLERSGTAAKGSITGIYTVLVEGSDLDEPVADEVRAIVDGHIVLDRALAARNHFPAIRVTQSLSRVMDAIVAPGHSAAARRVREDLAVYEAKRDLVELGAYTRGTDPKLDRALRSIEGIERFLRQERSTRSDFDATLRVLDELAR